MLLSRLLSRTLRRDPHATDTGDYHIRSLYFDGIQNASLTQKLEGLENRRKTRIRIYNFSEVPIRLESKEKVGGYIRKQSIMLARDMCDALLVGDPRCLLGTNEPLGPQVYALMRTQLLKPTVIVDYVREAYIHPLEDVRVTFDKDLRTGLAAQALFDPGLRTIPIFSGGEVIMEIKFNRYLPSYIASLVQVERAARMALSKYVLCRQYES